MVKRTPIYFIYTYTPHPGLVWAVTVAAIFPAVLIVSQPAARGLAGEGERWRDGRWMNKRGAVLGNG